MNVSLLQEQTVKSKRSSDSDEKPPRKSKKPRASELEPLRRKLIEDAQMRFAAAVVTKNPYPRDHVEDEMIYKAFREAVEAYAIKVGEAISALSIDNVLTPNEWQLVSGIIDNLFSSPSILLCLHVDFSTCVAHSR